MSDTVLPYSEAWHRDLMDKSAAELAKALEEWLAIDREDPTALAVTAGRLQLHARNVSANAAALALLSSERYWRQR